MGSDSQREELRHRVEAKKKDLESRLEELKGDSAQSRRQAREAIEEKLNELNTLIGDGWDQLSERTAERLNRWLR